MNEWRVKTRQTLGPGVGGLKTVTRSQQPAGDVGNVCGRVAAVVTDHHGTGAMMAVDITDHWASGPQTLAHPRNTLCRRCQITHVDGGTGEALCVISHSTWQLYFDTCKNNHSHRRSQMLDALFKRERRGEKDLRGKNIPKNKELKDSH